MKYSIKVSKAGKVVQRNTTHKIRRFLKILRLVKFGERDISVYLRVRYGDFPDVFGKIIEFYNDGQYDNKEECSQAAYAFTEEE